MAGVAPPGAADRCRFDQSSSGAPGAQDCQAEITWLACDHGQLRKNSTISDAGWVRNENDVATPKLPPPPPRHAQNRSLSRPASQSRVAPSAVTTWTDSRLSQVRPYARETTPIPPPSARPAIPTVEHEPPGTVTPWAASVAYRSMSRVTDPTVATPEPLSSRTEASSVPSTARPVLLDQPA